MVTPEVADRVRVWSEVYSTWGESSASIRGEADEKGLKTGLHTRQNLKMRLS